MEKPIVPPAILPQPPEIAPREDGGSPESKAADIPRGIRNTSNVASYSCFDSANKSLVHIQEWGKWMAGIQAAAIGGLGTIVLKANNFNTGVDHLPILGLSRWLAGISFVFLTAALFFTAWVLSSVASIALRLGVHAKAPYDVGDDMDIYNWQAFTWSKIRLGHLMGWQHWCWGIGLVFFGAFCVAFLWP